MAGHSQHVFAEMNADMARLVVLVNWLHRVRASMCLFSEREPYFVELITCCRLALNMREQS